MKKQVIAGLLSIMAVNVAHAADAVVNKIYDGDGYQVYKKDGGPLPNCMLVSTNKPENTEIIGLVFSVFRSSGGPHFGIAVVNTKWRMPQGNFYHATISYTNIQKKYNVFGIARHPDELIFPISSSMLKNFNSSHNLEIKIGAMKFYNTWHLQGVQPALHTWSNCMRKIALKYEMN